MWKTRVLCATPKGWYGAKGGEAKAGGGEDVHRSGVKIGFTSGLNTQPERASQLSYFLCSAQYWHTVCAQLASVTIMP